MSDDGVTLAVEVRDSGADDEDLDELAALHPGVEIQYLGPPFHRAPALESAIAALRPADSDEPALLAAAVARAFDGDLERFGRFMSALQGGVPPGTRLVLRGSAVQGESYRTGEPFDARGPGTSDLDVVLLQFDEIGTGGVAPARRRDQHGREHTKGHELHAGDSPTVGRRPNRSGHRRRRSSPTANKQGIRNST